MSYGNCSVIKCQNGAECLMNEFEAVCDCIPCFGGDLCEKNLTRLIPIYVIWSNNLSKTVNWYFVVLECFIIIMLLDSFLCFQTVL